MDNLDKDLAKKLRQYNGLNTKIKHSTDSDSALKNKYRIFRKFELLEFQTVIDWNYRHSHSIKTYQVYLHSLHFVRTLTDSYLIKKDVKYLVKAKNIIEQWINSPQNEDFKSNNGAWKDHSVASRMKNIIHFQSNVPKSFKVDSKKFDAVIIKHCNFLSLKENYSENNHGMMSDEALLFLSNFIVDNEKSNFYKEISVIRMERIIYKLFSSMSYNLENSPEYHRLTQSLSTRFIKLADIMNVDFDERCRAIISKSYINNSKIVKPDLSYPLIGDTGLHRYTDTKIYKNLIDYQAGLAVINSLNEQKKENSSWLSFKSGYLNLSHKHKDDLSVNYVHNGEDILIDTGKYTYDRKNPFKSYVMSPQAHSTIYNIKNDYELNNVVNDVDKMRIIFVYENDLYIHLAGINHLYKGLKIYRDIIYFENKGLVIIDRCFSDKARFMGQNFNLAPNIIVKPLSKNDFKLETPNGQTLYLTEHTENTLNKYFAHNDKARGFYSENFNELKETHQVEFRKNSFESIFITTLFNTEKNVSHIKRLDSEVRFKMDNKDYSVNLQKIDRNNTSK